MSVIEILKKHGWVQNRWEKCLGCGGTCQIFTNKKKNGEVEISCCGELFHHHSKEDKL